MWDERDCGDKRNSVADIRSSWIIIAAIILGMAAWWDLQLLLSGTPEPITVGGDVLGSNAE